MGLSEGNINVCVFRSEGTAAYAVNRQKLRGHCLLCSLVLVFFHMRAVPHPVTM